MCYCSSGSKSIRSVDITQHWLENDNVKLCLTLTLFSSFYLWYLFGIIRPAPCWDFLKMHIVSSHKSRDDGAREKEEKEEEEKTGEKINK